MADRAIPAVFMRGGTSKAIMFHRRDLPANQADWDPIFLAAMGSPDPYGRQLDGMGGGVSSLSKVCVLSPSDRPGVDIDFTFAQILIKEATVDYSANCGNMSSAVGPFAVDEGLVKASGDQATVTIYNTNTKKIIRNVFALRDGRARYDGDLEIPGVAGTGAPIRLDFVEPGGASTGKLLPTGRTIDTLDVPGVGKIEATLVDAGNAVVFVRARDLGLTGLELPAEITGDAKVMAKLDAIRTTASVAMGIAKDEAQARKIKAIPYIGFIAPPAPFKTLTGEQVAASAIDIGVRMLSSGQPHNALPLTASLCTAVAARLPGTLVTEALSPTIAPTGPVRLGMPSGVLTVGAEVGQDNGVWVARFGAFYRTARRLFDGRVWAPDSITSIRAAAE